MYQQSYHHVLIPSQLANSAHLGQGKLLLYIEIYNHYFTPEKIIITTTLTTLRRRLH